MIEPTTIDSMSIGSLKQLIVSAGLSPDGIVDKADLREAARTAANLLNSSLAAEPGLAWERCGGEQKFVDVQPGFSQGRVRGVWFQTPARDIPAKPEGVLRFVCISDTHERIEVADFILPAGDVLLHAGDFTQKGDVQQAARFCDWLKTIDFQHKVVIAGNHDGCSDPAFAGLTATETVQLLKDSCSYLHDASTSVHGVHIYGTPFTCWAPRDDGQRPMWAHGVTRGASCSRICAQIPPCDVVISHQPPLGRGDSLMNVGHGHAGGCADLLAAVQNRAPAVHVFGHIHEGHGVTSDGQTVFINAATLADGKLGGIELNHPIVFDLELEFASAMD